MTPPSRKPGNLRVFYAPGPGHVIGTFIHWKSGRSEPFEPAITYSSQFYEVCRELGAQARVVTACPHRGFLEEGLFRIEHRPHRLRSASGIWFHIGQIWNGMRLIVRAIRFRADVFIVAEGSHWFLFSLLCLAGIRVVPSLQSRVYGSASGQGFVPRMVAKLNGCFFRRGCHAIISMPHELPEQVDRLTGHRPPPIVEFLPQYDPDTFASTSPASFSVRPFRVLYVGRIERSKGVFDLLAVARRFGHEGRDEVEFDLCGGGSALDELRQAAKQGGVAERLRCHGHCETLRLRRMFASAHVVIIPTRTESGEGFNKTSIEAVLCGRPVITSRAWTARPVSTTGTSATA